MKNKTLDSLVNNETIKSYTYMEVEGTDGPEGENDELLVLVFANGETLTVQSFCCGASGKTNLIFQ